MLNMIGKKVNAKIGNTIKTGTIYDINTNGSKIWVQTNEDIFIVNSENVTEIKEVPTKTEKASSTITFGKYEHEDIFGEIEYRQLTIDITLTSETEEGVNNLWEIFSKKLEATSDLEINWSTCPTIDQNKNGMWYYAEGFTIDYEHGCMTEIKKDFMDDYKTVKKELGIR